RARCDGAPTLFRRKIVCQALAIGSRTTLGAVAGYAIKVAPGETIDLREHDPARHDGLTRDDALAALDRFQLELAELQEELYGAAQHSVLVVLQGLDASGKDGVIRRVINCMSPQGVRVESFKVPTAEELAHDFLWRVHRVVPRKGMVGVFNRSHYEAVL